MWAYALHQGVNDGDMGSLGGKRRLNRPRREWDDIMEMDHLEV